MQFEEYTVGTTSSRRITKRVNVFIVALRQGMVAELVCSIFLVSVLLLPCVLSSKERILSVLTNANPQEESLSRGIHVHHSNIIRSD